MRRLVFVCACAGLLLAGCAGSGVSKSSQTKHERDAQVKAAAHALKVGKHDHAEQLMADYLYRDSDGELRFRFVSFTPQGKKQAIDTVALLLWETGRDSTLEGFANRYLNGYERGTMLCRLAERNAQYEKAYHCWNELGDVDRARRSVRTEAALRLLKD